MENNIAIEKKVFKSSSGVCDIHVTIWHPDKNKYEEPVGIIQIAHGMIDHIERYTEMAEFFANRGFIVAGNDHLGHGESVASKEDWGYFAEGKNSGVYLVKDMYKLTKIMKKNYGDLPYIIVGHSMGSFMTRMYLMNYGNEVDAALILGTGNQPRLMVQGGLISSSIVALFKKDRYRSKLLKKLMFGSYNKKIPDAQSENAWISRDSDIVNAYDNDEKCTYMFTANGYIGFMKIIKEVIKDTNIRKTPVKLPILFAAGKEDPVGNYGAAVEEIYNKYKDCMEDVELKLYEGCRHELHSELNRNEIFEDFYEWILSKISDKNSDEIA